MVKRREMSARERESREREKQRIERRGEAWNRSFREGIRRALKQKFIDRLVVARKAARKNSKGACESVKLDSAPST
jgi:hypothetical protein